MFGKQRGRQISAADSCADEILFEVHKLNRDQAEQFFGWMTQHLAENNFNVTCPSPDEQLRCWLNLQSTALLLLEVQLFLDKAEGYGKTKN
jgi:hypothetical protein